MMVHQLSKKDAPLRAMVGSPQLVQAVVKAMGETTDPTVTRYTAGTLYHMSQHSQGLLAIFESGGIRALVRLLGFVFVCHLSDLVVLRERGVSVLPWTLWFFTL